LICAIVVTLIISIFAFTYPNNNPKGKFIFKYTVELNSSGDNRYTVYIPIPTNDQNFTNLVFNHLKEDSDNIEYSLIKTEFGLALNISAFGNVTLRAEGATYPFPYSILSLRNNTDMKYGNDLTVSNQSYYVYYSKTFISQELAVTIRFECTGKSIDSEAEVSGILIGNGWQTITGYEHTWQE